MMWLLPLLLISLGMMACLGLFLSLKSDLRVRARHSEEHIQSMLLRLEQAAAQAGSLERPAEVESPTAAAPAAYAPLRSGMNLTRRTEALRLLRRGEDISHVAAALAVSRSEIELLIRVQELVAHRTAETSQAAQAG